MKYSNKRPETFCKNNDEEPYSDIEKLFYRTYENIMKLRADVLIIHNGSGLSQRVLKENGEGVKVGCKSRIVKRAVSFEHSTGYEDTEFFVIDGNRLDYRHIVSVCLPVVNPDIMLCRKRILRVLEYITGVLGAESFVIYASAFACCPERTITAAVNTWLRTVNPYIKAAVAVSPTVTSRDFEETFMRNSTDLPPAPEKEITINVNKEGLSEKIDELLGALSDSAVDIADYRIYDKKLTALKEKYSHYNSKAKVKQQILSDYICGYLDGGFCTASGLSEITGIEPSAISKYKNGDHAPRSKETAIALALGMELSEEDRYVLINALGHEYPQDKRDFCIELAARKGSYNGGEIIELIDGMFREKTLYNYSVGDKGAVLRR